MGVERLDQYGSFLQTTANKASELIRSSFDNPIEVSFKEDGTPVTAIDKAIDYMVLSSVQSTFPDYGYLGEETGGEVSSDRFWVCDPLDGTNAYLNGIPLATYSLSLVEDKEIVISIIHDPFTDRSLLAAKGEGAWMNGRRLRVSKQQTLLAADVHMSWGDEGYIHRLSSLRKLGAKVIKMDANIYVGMLIAMGKFDGDIFTGDSLWDIAPQSLAVREAGGVATTLDGNEIPVTKSVNGLILSNGYLHHKLIEIVQESQRGIE